jgi:hypothetical protein
VKPWIRRDRFVAGVSRLLPFLIRMPGLSRGALAGHVLDVTARRNTLRHLYGTYRALIAPTEFLYRAYGDNGFYPGRLRKIHFGISQELVRGSTGRERTAGDPSGSATSARSRPTRAWTSWSTPFSASGRETPP